jgi:amidase
MGRTVEDVANLLVVMAGENPAVPFGRGLAGVVAGHGRDIRGLRIGWLGDWGGAWPMEPGILALCEAALRDWEGMGARVAPLAPPVPAQDLWQAWTTLRSFLNAQRMRPLWQDPDRHAALKPETRWEIAQGRAVTADALHAASVIRSRWYAVAAGLFDHVDLLALPSAQVWPFPVDWRWPEQVGGVRMDTYHRWMEVVIPAALAGLPTLAVPAGFGPQGLPMGLQLIGRAGTDAAVLAAGQAWHAATDWPGRRPPPIAGLAAPG